ncbi:MULTISPECIES: dipeptide ABC transporter ATP-binding protein [Hyphomicrobiales]|uniref:ABC transporter related n=2 Tax=Brucella/Ochrobactrum group TaxID=2826938 RepID=A6X830_BRUA4|nr:MULTISPECIES: ABC transporter ATP-binding protein [Hyphomicrobiales]ABS17384.1 ABC transporter related [Brucella anthropi ATCC 49188]AIH15733.1 oligopeptide transport ATP-binding protein [Ochrobactrum sp. SJY1]QQC28781.1 ABC transporter ATP-binding protein [Brucella anthropi]CDN96318.1 ATPase component of various ABC-type transport systems with duplicated ATPase domain protein [Agrobacterium tumefaciens]
MSELLDVRSLRTYFETDKGTVKSVDDISFTLKRGEVMGLVGESGSGKSITGFSLIGLLDETGRIQEGSSIRFNGRELVGLDGKELRKLRGKDISMVFQDPMMTLNPVVRIIDQIGMAIRAHEQVSDAEVRRRAVEALAKVKIVDPESKVDQYPHEFSGGMRQRVAIAIALLHRPQLVIADEPTTALDVSVQAEILIMVKALVAEMGTSLIWVSHDLATVSSIADTIAVMRRGKIVESGPARQVLHNPQHPYTQGLLDALPSRSMPGKPLASAATEAAGPMDLSGLGGTALGAAPDEAFVKAEAIEKIFARRIGFLRGLGIRWGLLREPGPVHAVISANLTIARGEILGLVGESGSGKSTLGRILCGIYPPTSGTVSVGGKPVRSATGKLGTHVQMIFQDPFASLDPRRTIFQSVAEGPIAHGFCTRANARDYVNRWLRAVAFDPALADRYPHQFSGGQRQRIAIARALAMQPEVIICDEPVASLDVSIQAQVINLLMELRRNLNITLLFISHDLSVVHHLCDRVVVMRHGEIVEQGTATQVFTTPRHAYTKMLLEAVPKLETRPS